MRYDNNIAHFHQSVDMSSDREERFFQRQQRQRFAEATAKDEQIAALEAAAVENQRDLAVKDHRIAVLEAEGVIHRRDLYRATENNRNLCDTSIYITLKVFHDLRRELSCAVHGKATFLDQVRLVFRLSLDQLAIYVPLFLLLI